MNYKVYCHISPSNKIYIGITQQGVNKRWQNGKGYKGNQYFYRAIQKYGWDNFQHEILFENLTKQEAEKKEIELIKKYDSTNINKGYNILEGGNATSGLKGELNGMYGVHRYGKENPNYGKKHSAESREKISKNHANMKGGNNPNAKAIRNKSTGEIFPSAREASEKYGVTPSAISSSIRRVNKCVGCYWEYIDNPQKIENIEKMVKERITGRKGYKVRNIETGEVFRSLAQAGKTINKGSESISRAIKRKGKSGGYHWEYVLEKG